MPAQTKTRKGAPKVSNTHRMEHRRRRYRANLKARLNAAEKARSLNAAKLARLFARNTTT